MDHSTSPSRKKRFTREPGQAALTPLRLALLKLVADLEVTIPAQVACIAGRSEHNVRRALRPCFDAGWVDYISVHPAALSGEGPSLRQTWYGSAPTIMTITAAGQRVLLQAGLLERCKPVPRFSPANSLFLRHALGVSDLRIAFTLAARDLGGARLEIWRQGSEAAIPLPPGAPQKRLVPDAWFCLRLGEQVLVGLLEVDGATEGPARWKQKLAAYASLFSGGTLKATTGYAKARVLVVAPTVSRRNHLADLIAAEANPDLRDRFWLAELGAVKRADLSQVCWRRPGSSMLVPLLPADPARGAAGRSGAERR